MATEFAMPVQSFAASPSQYTLYHAQQPQSISPLSSATATPSNVSPTSPRTSTHLPTHTRQLRPPKSPLYVPAVLRPTDPPRRAARSSPTQSMNNSFDSLENAHVVGRKEMADHKKGTLGLIVETEFSVEGLGKVTASPTKEHWKPDADSPICDETTCQRYFTYFTRRHHCRRCGNIFCDAHSLYTIPLDQDANYHPRGTRSRACEHCWGDYRSWQIARSSRSNSESSEDSNEPSTPTVKCGTNKRGVMAGVFGKPEVGSLGASVPRDWNWSTF